MMRSPVFLLWVLAAALSPAAGAKAASGDLFARYQVFLGGFHIADASVALREAEGAYRDSIQARTRGLLDSVVRLNMEASSTGTFAGPGYRPSIYQGLSSSRWRDRELILRNLGEGRMAAVEERVLAEREVSRDWKPPPPVPDGLRVGVFDPLTAIRESIAHVRAHLGGGPARFKIPVFDGTRRFDIAYEFRGRSARTLGKDRYDTYWVRMTPQPMAGFSARNLEFWEGAAFDIYLDRDADLVPVQIMPLENGPVLNLVETCATICPLPEAERS